MWPGKGPVGCRDPQTAGEHLIAMVSGADSGITAQYSTPVSDHSS